MSLSPQHGSAPGSIRGSSPGSQPGPSLDPPLNLPLDELRCCAARDDRSLIPPGRLKKLSVHFTALQQGDANPLAKFTGTARRGGGASRCGGHFYSVPEFFASQTPPYYGWWARDRANTFVISVLCFCAYSIGFVDPNDCQSSCRRFSFTLFSQKDLFKGLDSSALPVAQLPFSNRHTAGSLT